MRRAWVVLALLVGLAVAGRGQDKGKKAPPPSPYAGTWKVSVLDNGEEIAVWLLRLDPAAKAKAAVVWGVTTRQNDFSASVPTLLKADAFGLRLNLHTEGRDYALNAVPPSAKNPNFMLGSVTIGYQAAPVRLVRTDEKSLSRDKGVVRMDGAVELEAATQLGELAHRLSAFEGLLTQHAGKPITLVAAQVAVTHLLNANSDPAAFKKPIAALLKEAAPYGREMQIGARFALCRTLLGAAKTRELALEQARGAVKLIKEKEDPHLVQIYAYVLLASTLEVLGKKDDVKLHVPKVKSLVAAAHKAAGDGAAGLAADLARLLLSSPAPAVADLGLEQARRSVELLGDKAPTWQRLAARRLLQAALLTRGHKDEASKVGVAADRLEDDLDREYLKEHVPFKVAPFGRRKGASTRAVLVEMVSNAEVLVCAATDVAFDALRQTFKPADVVLLQYHRAAAAADPLTVPAVEARVKQYGEAHAGNVPSFLIDGVATEAMGGHRTQAKARYDTLRGRIEKALEAPAEAAITLRATRKKDEVEVTAEVSELARPGERTRLHLLLVEGVIRYEGGNGQRLHHDVVRALLTPAGGVKLEKKEARHSVKVDLAELRKAILAHLAEQAKKDFYPPDRPVELKGLKVVAVVQDGAHNRALQAAITDVKEAK